MELVSADQTRSRGSKPRKEGYFSIYWGMRRMRTLKTSLGPTVVPPSVRTIPTWYCQSSSQWWQAEAAQGSARAWSSCPSSWSTGSARPLACPALLPAGYPNHQALQKKKNRHGSEPCQAGDPQEPCSLQKSHPEWTPWQPIFAIPLRKLKHNSRFWKNQK